MLLRPTDRPKGKISEKLFYGSLSKIAKDNHLDKEEHYFISMYDAISFLSDCSLDCPERYLGKPYQICYNLNGFNHTDNDEIQYIVGAGYLEEKDAEEWAFNAIDIMDDVISQLTSNK